METDGNILDVGVLYLLSVDLWYFMVPLSQVYK